MTRLIHKEIDVLISKSNDIAEHVRLKNWDSVEILTAERQLALEDFFNEDITVDDAKKVEQMIQNILKIDHHMVDFIENEQKNTFNDFSSLKKNNEANKTYQNIASFN